MRGDLLDLVLVVAVVVFGVSGYRQGLVVGVLSLVGFLGGGVLGARVAPDVAALSALDGVPPALVGLAVVVLCAVVGQLLATAAGALLRARITWHPARRVDAFGGALVSIASLLLVAWLVGAAFASSSSATLASQIRRSVVLGAVDDAVPDSGRRFVAGFRRLVDERGFPDVFGGLAPTASLPVPPPDAALAASPVVAEVRDEVLKVTGLAPSCRRRIEGTGFLYADERVMTNAHVVAGVTELQVELTDGSALPGTVVLFDPGRDVAVLRVPGLTGSPLQFATGEVPSGADGIIVGYPQDSPFRADPARVRDTQRARGPDIYQRDTVVREIYSLFGRVQPGNSGGPLLDAAGDVIGVIFAAAADDPQTGYALTAGEVAGAAATGAGATEPVSTQACD